MSQETMFRGAIPWGLGRCGIGSKSACALSSIAFAAAHAPQSAVGYLELVSVGVVLMLVRVWGGLRAAMVCHAVYLWTIALLPL
ncbi:MAG: CPBP family intramembrane metalloprotease [Planctomycetes bacterium]|nr:CPBP family intramembrane metalloprotease [Planctomycetota bacterium]